MLLQLSHTTSSYIEIKKHLDENNDLVMDEGSVVSEVLGRLERGTIEMFRTDGTYNEFKLIVNVCFPPMVPAKHWKQNKGEVAVTDLLTISDEALALIVLENNYEEWIDRAKGVEVHKKSRKTKYTHGGQKKNGTRKGWSLEGRQRFNTIFTAIKLERDQATSREREDRLKKEWAPKKDKGNNEEEGSDEVNVEEDDSFVPMTDFDFD